MRKLILTTQMTVDGVIDDPSGWFVGDDKHEGYGLDTLIGADALLLGRKTYDGLASVWPQLDDEAGWGHHMNSKPKYVASRTASRSLGWNAELLRGDLAPAVRKLKSSDGRHLLMYGLGEAARHLLEEGLVDDLRIFVHPALAGHGARVFGGELRTMLHLAAVTAYDSGVVMMRYEPISRGS